MISHPGGVALPMLPKEAFLGPSRFARFGKTSFLQPHVSGVHGSYGGATLDSCIESGYAKD